MRIAFVTLQYPPEGIGGIGTYVQTVATSIAAAGHDVTVICATGEQPRSTTFEHGVRVERFPALGPAWIWKRMVLPRQTMRVRMHVALSAAWALWRSGHRFDVIEAPEWKAQGLLLGLARRGPVVVHIHLTFELENAWNDMSASLGRRVSYGLERRTAARAAALTATSRQTTRFPDGSTWVPDDRVTLVAPPITSGEWGSCRPIAETGPTVLFVGRLERRKDPSLLLVALSRLTADVEGLRVVFVGRSMTLMGRPYSDHLRCLAAEYEIDCEILDPVSGRDEMRVLFDDARVVAVPSRFEPLSMVAFEAMASGRPAVMTNSVGAAEWVGEELPDLVVPFGDAAAFAEALRPHLIDAAHAESVGERARQLVGETCARDCVVASRIGVYRDVSGC